MSPLRIALFLVIVSTILFGGHYYVWARLVRDTGLDSPWRDVLTWTLAALGVLVLVGFVVMRGGPRAWTSPVMWVVYTWLGVIFFLVALLGSVDVARVAVWVVRRTLAFNAVDPERRLFVARLIGGVVGFGALGLAGAGLANALRSVAVRRVRIDVAKLPSSASGYTIVQLSDVHVGPTIGKEFIEELVAKVNALSPDLVAITGDLVDGRVAELGPLVAPLAGLKAKDGVYFVTGNHEYYSGVDDWLAFLNKLGIRVLRNERVAIGGDGGFDLAGIDDYASGGFSGHGPDLPRALEGRDATRALVLLAHQPKAIHEAERLGVGLQLSGHTHGGQLFPFNYLVKLQQPYIAGLHAHGRAKIYVSRGTGYWGPPMRLGAPAEITQIELAPA